MNEPKIGDKINRWTIVELFKKNNGKQNISMCKVKCYCGNESIIRLTALRTGQSKSCGCLTKEKFIKRLNLQNSSGHGLSKHPLYKVWNGIKGRCLYKSQPGYKNYGGRGIKVCYEWLKNFLSFYNWAISNGWQEGLQLDRIDNDGNYEPANCQFISRKQNIDNRRITLSMTAFGETKTIREWSLDERCKCSYGSLLYRVQHDWKPEIALTKSSPNTDNFRAYKTLYHFIKDEHPDILEEFLNK